MKSNSSNLLFYIISALLYFVTIVSAEYVPVYMWDTTTGSEVLPALSRISEESFGDLLLEQVSKDKLVVVFAEQNLSPEDFSLHGISRKNPFTQLSALKKSSKVSYFPFVANPINALKHLPDKTITEVSLKSALDQFEPDLFDSQILIVDLNDAKENEDRFEMLHRHDKIITSIYNKVISGNKHVLALYTGHHSSWVIPEEVRSHRRVREAVAKADENSTGHVYSTTNMLLYLKDFATFYNNGTTVRLDKLQLTTNIYDNTSVTADLTQDKINISLMISFEPSGYWLLNNVTLRDGTESINITVSELYAPNAFSYHCYNQTFVDPKNANFNVTFPGFQMQPTLDNITNFGDAYDCVGFTSAPIWSGIFVTFILVLIMTFGLSMMMDIKTMDRFDDPKGKTITINVAE